MPRLVKTSQVRRWAQSYQGRYVPLLFLDPGETTGIVMAKFDREEKVLEVSSIHARPNQFALPRLLILGHRPELVVAEMMPPTPTTRNAPAGVLSWQEQVVVQLVDPNIDAETLWVMPGAWKPLMASLGYPSTLNKIRSMYGLEVRWGTWKPAGQTDAGVGIQGISQHQKDALGMGIWFVCLFFCIPRSTVQQN